jgi:anti-anti-sigma regulatory factor
MLRHARADPWLVVLDLRELEFIDSGGVHLLLAASRRAREAGGRKRCGSSDSERVSTDAPRRPGHRRLTDRTANES